MLLWLHGLRGSAQVQRAELERSAKHGYIGVAIDGFGHGARRYPDFDERFGGEQGERSYFETVVAASNELPRVVAELRAYFSRPVGACGISMGGATLFGALAAGCQLEAAVTIVASPEWKLVPQVSPHQRLEAFGSTPLLSLTAGRDEIVSSEDSRLFHEAVAPRFAPDTLKLRHFAEEAHLFTQPGWEAAMAETLAWFDRWVRPG